MAEIVTVKLNASKLNLKLDEMSKELHDALLAEVKIEGTALRDSARSIAGEVLQVHTGSFVESIKAGARQTENSVTGRVYSRDRRANLFEWGGHTEPREIDAHTAHALRFLAREGFAFAAHVDNPGGQYKGLQIIHSAFAAMEAQIESELESIVRGITDGTLE